jgi:hypothetical protein
MEGTGEKSNQAIPGVDAVLWKLLEPLERAVSECNWEVVDLVIVVSSRGLDRGGI